MIKTIPPTIIKNGEKIITSKKNNGFEVINTWITRTDRCDLVSKQIKDEFINITQQLEDSKLLKGLRISGERNSHRFGVDIHQKISGFLQEKKAFINLPIKELVNELFSGKFDDTISLQKGNQGRKIWNKLGVVDYILNEKELYSIRKIKHKSFIHKAIFPNFKYNGITLSKTEDFNIETLSTKAQRIAKQAIKEYNEFIK